jgi:hypothetical protein
MKVKDFAKIQEVIGLLETAMDEMNDAVELEDCELRKENDFYAKIQDIVNDIEEVFSAEFKKAK